jgi:hypothetical protein
MRQRVTRSSSSAIIAAAALFAVSVPTRGSAQRDTPRLDGRWTLNRALSQIPRDVGFNLEALSPAAGARPATASGGRGRRGSSGGGGVTGDPYRSRPQSADDASRVRQLTAEVRNPSAHLTISESQGAFTIAGDRGQPRTFRPDGKQTVLQLDDVPVPVTATSEAGTLVVVYHVEPNHDLRYSYASTSSPAQLIVDIQFVERGGGDSVRLVYEPTRDTETAAPAPAAPPSRGPAPASGGQPAAPQPFNQRPDAELSGLNALGLVVEDLSAQATACGLNKDTIETALSDRLSKAGLKVQRNADEDTYLYVHIITTGPSNGLCVSRYDAFLYTHTTATLSYQTTPVLVQVELMHKGSMTGSALTSHAGGVLRALLEYVDQFAVRISNANK